LSNSRLEDNDPITFSLECTTFSGLAILCTRVCNVTFKDRWHVPDIFFKTNPSLLHLMSFRNKFSVCLLYQFYTPEVMISDSITVNTSDYHANGPGFNPRRWQGLTHIFFSITTYWHTIFLQQPGIIKILNSKLDLVRYL
jgi:hypothetical protein